MDFLSRLFNTVLENQRLPGQWRKSVLVPVLKNKSDVQICSNYRVTKGMNLTVYMLKLGQEER